MQQINIASCPIPKKPEPKIETDEDDGVDLFGSDSDEDDKAAAKVREERLAAYAAKKAKSKFHKDWILFSSLHIIVVFRGVLFEF